MSADNWTICPKCKINNEAVREQERRRIATAYGKVTPEQYKEMCHKYDTQPEQAHTLREDYGQGIDEDGEYSCIYRCSCIVCGFSFNFSTKIEPETVFKQNKP